MLTRVQQRALCGVLLLVLSGCGGGGGTGQQFTNLYCFGSSSTDGLSPDGGLLQASDGNFYGTTFAGGIGAGTTPMAGYTGNGTVFKITPTGEETVLYLFAGYPADGEGPNSLIQGSDGNFYGVTSNGGSNNSNGGTIFQLTPTGVVTGLYSFGFSASVGPNHLVQGSDGNLYGTTSAGGGGPGCFYKFVLSSN
jgi:uncharacterized repeat protein (TIGR03803 family)